MNAKKKYIGLQNSLNYLQKINPTRLDNEDAKNIQKALNNMDGLIKNDAGKRNLFLSKKFLNELEYVLDYIKYSVGCKAESMDDEEEEKNAILEAYIINKCVEKSNGDLSMKIPKKYAHVLSEIGPKYPKVFTEKEASEVVKQVNELIQFMRKDIGAKN